MAFTRDKFDWIDNVESDDSAIRYEYTSFPPTTGVNKLNDTGTITFEINSSDSFIDPSESYLLFQGRMVKASNGAAFADTDVTSIVNNGIMYLYSEISYSLEGQQVERIADLGQATTIMKTLLYDDDKVRNEGESSFWVKDSSNTASKDVEVNRGFSIRHSMLLTNVTNLGKFEVIIPLKEIFGFCEDYNKVIYGLKHTLKLVRKFTDNDALFKASGGTSGKITLEKLEWRVPQAEPSTAMKALLLQSIESKTEIEIDFRKRTVDSTVPPGGNFYNWPLTSRTDGERPHFIILAFQTDRDNDQTKNTSTFDHCNVESLSVSVGSEKYPSEMYKLNISDNQFKIVHRDMSHFKAKYTGFPSDLVSCNVSATEWKNLFPIYIIDISKQSERLKTASPNVIVNMTFKQAPAANTRIFAITISDRKLKMKSNGNSFKLVY